MKYVVILRETRLFQAEVEVEANSPEEAENLAFEQSAEDSYEEIDGGDVEVINVIELKEQKV